MARKEASPLPLAAPLTFVLALGVFLAAGGFGQRPSGTTRAGAPAAVAAAAVQRGALAFEPTGHGGYRTRGSGYDLFVDGSGSRLLVRGKRAGGLDAQLVGARRGSRALAGDK